MGEGIGAALRAWSPRRWVAAAAAATVVTIVVGVPTDLIDTPVFSREVPLTSWAWPSLVVSSVLTGMLLATYVADPGGTQRPVQDASSKQSRTGGWVGASLTFFAVGCPVCNKLVILAVGYSGAMSWFAPLQPVLQLIGIAVLIWALATRLRSSAACPRPSTPRPVKEPS